MSEDLVDRFPHLALEVFGASTKLKIQLGWHYLLDIVWILSELELKEGKTVLDAGAGNGLLQFILADRGYRVISADMTVRKPPRETRGIYEIEQMGESGELEHAYLDHHGSQRRPGGVARASSLFTNLLETPVRQIPSKIRQRLRPSRPRIAAASSKQEALPPAAKLPHIDYYRCRMDKMPELEDGSVDAIVSVSALEHNRADDIKVIMAEMTRILRPGGAMLHTISACARGAEFHEPSHSWLLDDAGITDAYGLDNPESNFPRFDDIFDSLKKSKYLKRWLSSFYYQGGKNGMPWGVWEPQYQPTGVRKVTKDQR